MKKYIMGIDIGGTKCAVLLGRAQGDADDIIIDKLRFETRVGRGWRAVTEELLDRMLGEARALALQINNRMGATCMEF